VAKPREQIYMAETTVLATGRTPPVDSSCFGTVEEWLASAHSSPGSVHHEWDNAGRLALIPLGRRFEAVRIPEDIVEAAAGCGSPAFVGAWLTKCLHGGPVIHDPRFRRYYPLVPPHSAEKWLVPGTERLGEGTYLGVPRADRTEFDSRTRASYWAVPMRRPGRLCGVADVLALVVAGGGLAGEDDS
jgi:hypothetical protein